MIKKSTLFVAMALAIAILFLAGCPAADTDSNTYTVTFNGNDATTEASPATKSVDKDATDKTIDRLPSIPTKAGHTFAGWYLDKELKVAFSANSPVIRDITVYAKWEAVTTGSLVVTFNDEDATTPVDPAYKVVVASGSSVRTLPATAPVREGYNFDEWNTKADGSGDAFAADTAVTADITVYAKWTAAAMRTVTFDKNHADATDGVVTTLSVESGISVGATIFATVTPTRTGFTLAGWNTAADGTGTAFAADTVVTADITVYAQWTAVTFTVTFDKNDAAATDGSVTTLSVNSGASVGATALATVTPTKTDSTFTWNTKADGTGTAFADDTVVTADITVYAKWTTT